ncbi:MAG: hypothetical protein ABI668_02370 [Sphingorhabdus sp.]
MENESPRSSAPPPDQVAALPENPDTLVVAADPDTPPDYDAPDYNPADYRWVPVRRRPRYDGWTDEKQRHFIEVLADTGIVSHAAKAVGMSRESAARLRRSPHGAAFARAWDAARLHAGSALEDLAFERAIEGVEHNVYNEYGEVVCSKRVYNDRLLTFLLGALKPERYGRDARASAQLEVAPPPVLLEAELRAMEPQLPAPPEELLGLETLGAELEIAEAADGFLPHFFSEQRPAKTEARIKAEELAARDERGKAAWEKSQNNKGELSTQEFKDMCYHIDPTGMNERGRKRFR